MEGTFQCKKCGETKRWELFKKDKRKVHGIVYTCNSCNTLIQRKYYGNDLLRKRSSEYGKKNKEKISIRKKRYYHDEGGKNITKQYARNNKEKVREWSFKKHKNSRTNLTDYYIRAVLLKNGFSKEQIHQYPQLIEVQRLIIQTKRLQ